LDFATSGSPDTVRDYLNKTKSEDISIFRTVKYGTMTIIDKSKNNNKIEITPFRTESTYSDGRHPDEVVWSDDIYMDSQRRDFTMNCIYYTVIGDDKKIKGEKDKMSDDSEKADASLSEKQLEKLTKN
jgi:tRNA nucleotidyltransferase/poly(A) polymerase